MTAPTEERRIAAALLLRFDAERSGRLDQWLRGAPPRARVLTYGVLRNLLSLRAHLVALLRRPWERLDGPVRVSLLLGAWELAHCPDVPAATAVDQAVGLCRASGGGTGAGLVNATLRRLAQRPRPERVLPRDLAEAVVATSHPRWILDEMARRVPEAEVIRWALADNDPAPIVLHQRLGAPDLPGRRLGPGAIRLPEDAPALQALPGWGDGALWVQDAAAQWVANLADPGVGKRVLDLCAAPGGKSFLLGDRVGPQGHVAAWDVDPSRLGALEEERRRLGLGQVHPMERDLLARPWGSIRGDEVFDAVLVDAPCSALGVLRRHPEIRWARGPEDPAILARTQEALLRAAAAAVKPGGALVYAVCTFTDLETDGVLRSFLTNPPPGAWTVETPELPADLLDGPWLRTYPHRHDMDAFSAIRLRRAAC